MPLSKDKQPWYKGQLNIQTVAALITGMGAIYFFVFRTNDNDKDVKQLKIDIALKADRSELNATKDQINKQYQLNRDDKLEIQKQLQIDKAEETKLIEEVADWMHEQVGYHKKELESKK